MTPEPIRLLVATTNPGKLREIRPILESVPVKLVTLADLLPLEAPEETGRTFAENARLKALYYANATGLKTVAEDSGLEIDAMDGAPGIHSSRFGGVESSYEHKFDLIYEALRAKGQPGSPARFVCALAVADGLRVEFEARGSIEGQIAAIPSGDDGFGSDPIFFSPPFGCTLAEAGARKSAVSHRGQAFRKLRDYLTR